jgi:hypothetical protein
VSVRGYNLSVDWSNNGAYTNTLEDVSSYVLAEPALSVEWGRPDDLVSPIATATELTFALNNRGGQFSPGNVSSPITGLVRAGRKVRLQYLTGSTTTLFEGIIDRHSIDPSRADQAYTAQCFDMWGRPSDEKLSTPLFTAMRTGDAIGEVLDEIGWTGGRDLDIGATVMPYWWAEDESAASAIEKIVDSEGPPAIAYVQGGTFYFRDRHHRLQRTASQVSQATFTNKIVPVGSGPVGSYKIEKNTFEYDHGEENVVNSVTFTIEERRQINPGVVWETDDQIVVPASSSTVLHVQADDPFHSAITPVAVTDYTVLSGSVTSVSLSRTSGRALVITINGGAGGAVLNGFHLRATSVAVARSVKVTASDATSITANQGERGWPRDVPFANAYDAKAIADKIVATWKDPRPRLVFTVPNFKPSYLTEFLTAAISDRITVRDDGTGTNTDFVVERLRHTVTKFNVHRLTVWCQQADAAGSPNMLTFGVAGKGFGQGVWAQ